MNKKHIYIKKIEDVGKHSVWLVDGEYIRKVMNENFVEYDEHYHLPFIPKDEFWIDHITNSQEWYFFIDHMINEQWKIEKGISYIDAMKYADRIEKRERAKLIHIENQTTSTKSTQKILEKIHKERIKHFCSENLNVWLVDGKAVRDYLFVEYADGGHDYVYSFIPKGEIWLEDCLSKEELKFILLHELHERCLMKSGKDYTHAHRGATDVEDYYRDHPKDLDTRIQEELAKNARE